MTNPSRRSWRTGLCRVRGASGPNSWSPCIFSAGSGQLDVVQGSRHPHPARCVWTFCPSTRKHDGRAFEVAASGRAQCLLATRNSWTVFLFLCLKQADKMGATASQHVSRISANPPGVRQSCPLLLIRPMVSSQDGQRQSRPEYPGDNMGSNRSIGNLPRRPSRVQAQDETAALVG